MGHSFSLLYKFIILKGDYLNDWYHGHYYAKAQNQRRLLRESYDNALRDVDILAMPTTAPEGGSAATDRRAKCRGIHSGRCQPSL